MTTTRPNQWRPRAQNAALTRLSHEFWDHYRELLAEERAARPGGRPQSRAKTRLSHEHAGRYRELYNQERDRLARLPEAERFSAQPRGVQIRPVRARRQPRALKEVS